jgi:RND superfamily putative drug exporter
MSLVGRANWWLPRWLDRILPHVDLDGGQPEPGALTDEPQPELVAV